MWAQKTMKIVSQFVASKIKSMYHMQMWHVWLKCCDKGTLYNAIETFGVSLNIIAIFLVLQLVRIESS